MTEEPSQTSAVPTEDPGASDQEADNPTVIMTKSGGDAESSSSNPYILGAGIVIVVIGLIYFLS